jgi:hypothetical protein
MLNEKPGCYNIGNSSVGDKGGVVVHNPLFDFNDEALALGVPPTGPASQRPCWCGRGHARDHHRRQPVGAPLARRARVPVGTWVLEGKAPRPSTPPCRK